MATVGLREYARLRGVSADAVTKAIKSGRLSKSVKRNSQGWPKINVEIANEEWAANTHEGNSSIERLKRSDSLSGTYSQSKAVKESYLARLAKLDYEERSGKLVDAEEIKKESFRLARAVRDSLLNIPDRVAAEFAGITQPHEIHVRLSEEIRKALESLQHE